MGKFNPILMNEALLDDFLYMNFSRFCDIYHFSAMEYADAVRQVKFWAKVYKERYGKELREKCFTSVETTTATPSIERKTEEES